MFKHGFIICLCFMDKGIWLYGGCLSQSQFQSQTLVVYLQQFTLSSASFVAGLNMALCLFLLATVLICKCWTSGMVLIPIFHALTGVQKERMVPEDMYVLSPDGSILSSPTAKPYPHKAPKCSDCGPLFMKVLISYPSSTMLLCDLLFTLDDKLFTMSFFFCQFD